MKTSFEHTFNSTQDAIMASAYVHEGDPVCYLSMMPRESKDGTHLELFFTNTASIEAFEQALKAMKKHFRVVVREQR